MPVTDCGIRSPAGGWNPGDLALFGPTIFVHITRAESSAPVGPPTSSSAQDYQIALIDTGSSHSAIDEGLAESLRLPIVGVEKLGGIGGSHNVNVYVARFSIPQLGIYDTGYFSGVRLRESGTRYQALVGRGVLANTKLVYDGRSGQVTLET